MSPRFTPEALRSIGEDLELRGIRTFLIRFEGDLFVVEGGYQSPPATTPVSLHYSHKDITELDRKSRERSVCLFATRSFIYLPKILLSLENYVHDKGACLLSVSNIGSTETISVIDIEYETLQRERVFDRFMMPAIYALCVRDHKRRERRQDLNDKRYSRFSSLQEKVSGVLP
ncbi:MAG TPA: hypothetical protein VGD41_08920 [Pyrinomonadaceae bacterium]